MAIPELSTSKAQKQQRGADSKIELSVPMDKLAYIIVKAREFDAEVPPSGTEDGSGMSDDRAVAILEGTADNPTRVELTSALRELDVDQTNEVLALVWVGRGDFTSDSWDAALRQARELGDRRVVPYLIETPLLGDLLEGGLDELGYNITSEEEI